LSGGGRPKQGGMSAVKRVTYTEKEIGDLQREIAAKEQEIEQL
jgi:hypothetical protein